MEKFAVAYQKFNSEEGVLFRYSLSFSIFLAIFPTVIALVVAFSLTYSRVGDYIDLLYQILPQDLIEPLVSYVRITDYGSGTSLILTILAASYLASRSFYSFMLINKVDEGVDCPNFLIRIKAFVMYLIMLALLNVIALVNFYHFIPTFIINLVMSIGVFYLMFRSFSFKKQPLGYGLIGSLVTSSLVWLVLLVLFKYTGYATNYQSLYGPLSSILVGLLSVYFMATAIYAGYIVNGAFSKKCRHLEYKTVWYYGFGLYFYGLAKSFMKLLKSRLKSKFSR